MIDDLSTLPQVAPDYDLQVMLEAGCHFGHNASHWHPKMKAWIYMEKDGIHIFDLEKTAKQLQLAYNYLYDLGQKGKIVVFIGTKRQAREVIETKATEAKAAWITSRWLGGLLTNWEQVQKSIKRMTDLEEGLKNNTYSNYTKYEQMQLGKEKNRLARFFEGLVNLKSEPDVLVIVDPGKEKIAIKEAQITGKSVIALVDSNTNSGGVDLVIPANDDGRTSIEFVVTQLTEAYAKGKGIAAKAVAAAAAKASAPTAAAAKAA